MSESKTIVMTGGTSGFGKVAVEQLRASGVQIVLGTRKNTAVAGINVLPVDLASLESVRHFAAEVIRFLAGAKIDALVLNAGLSFPSADHRTVDGFETTFAVNHLGHYLLLRLLLPHLAAGAVVTFTTSGTHNPAENTLVPPPRHAEAHLLAFPDRDPGRHQEAGAAGGHAYAASKLCNLLTARALAAQNRSVVVAYDPGPIPGTGLSRNNTFAVRTIWQLLSFPLFRALFPKFNSKRTAGRILAGIALGRLAPRPGKVYLALRKGEVTYPDPSELAQDDAVMEKLWADSAQLLGIASPEVM